MWSVLYSEKNIAKFSAPLHVLEAIIQFLNKSNALNFYSTLVDDISLYRELKEERHFVSMARFILICNAMNPILNSKTK